MKGLKATLVSVLVVGLLASLAVGVAAHDEAEDPMSLPEPVEILAGLGLPGAMDDNSDTHSLGLYQYPGYGNISFVSDEMLPLVSLMAGRR